MYYCIKESGAINYRAASAIVYLCRALSVGSALWGIDLPWAVFALQRKVCSLTCPWLWSWGTSGCFLLCDVGSEIKQDRVLPTLRFWVFALWWDVESVRVYQATIVPGWSLKRITIWKYMASQPANPFYLLKIFTRKLRNNSCEWTELSHEQMGTVKVKEKF